MVELRRAHSITFAIYLDENAKERLEVNAKDATVLP